MNQTETDRIHDLIASELERPRPLTEQVLNHLAGTYGLARTAWVHFWSRVWRAWRI